MYQIICNGSKVAESRDFIVATRLREDLSSKLGYETYIRKDM